MRKLALLIAAVALLATCFFLSMFLWSSPRSGVVVAVYYYPWYGGGLGGRHWNDSRVNVVVDEPLIGYYSSLDERALEWQLGLMKKAGVDVLFVSWWGPGSYEDRAARLVFKLCRRYNLRAAILVEPYLGQSPSLYNESFWEEVLGYVYREYVEPYRDVYFKLNGKPLILAFNPVGEALRPSDAGFEIRVVGNDVDEKPGVDWDLWPDYLAPWTEPRGHVELRVRRDGYVAVAPRFDDSFLEKAGAREGSRARLLDPCYALRAYEEQWKWIMEHRDEVRIVAIYSWNEYHERSMIEPHLDATAPGKGLYPYSLTAKFVGALKHGVGGWSR